MNTNELKALGLTEMNEGEVHDVDGGIFGIDDSIVVGALIVIYLVGSVCAAYQKGVEASK